MRYIHLTDEEERELKSARDNEQNNQTRRRIESILLSNTGLQIKELAGYFGVAPKTIYQWLDLWEAGQLQGLRTKAGRGAKKKLRDIPEEAIAGMVTASSRNLRPVLTELSEKYNVVVSKKTLQRFLKISGL